MRLGELVVLGARAFGACPGVELAILGLAAVLVGVAQREVVHGETAGQEPLEVFVDAVRKSLQHIVGDGLAALGGGHVLEVLQGIGLVVGAEEEVTGADGRAAGGGGVLLHENDLLLGGLLGERDGGGEAGDASAYDEDVALLVPGHGVENDGLATQGAGGGRGGLVSQGGGGLAGCQAKDREACGAGARGLHERATRLHCLHGAHVRTCFLLRDGPRSVRVMPSWCAGGSRDVRTSRGPSALDGPDARRAGRGVVSHMAGQHAFELVRHSGGHDSKRAGMMP